MIAESEIHLLFPVDSGSVEETVETGRRLGQKLSAGAVVALYGDLGAGKTQFVRGICAGRGADPSVVTSPTFTLINEYESSIAVYHLDLYRISGPEEARRLGLDEYLFGQGITVIEWPEIIEDDLPLSTIRIHITHRSKESRRISLRP